MTLLDEIKIELENMDGKSIIEPDGEINSTDHVIGEVPESLKMLHSLALSWAKAADENLLALKYASGREKDFYISKYNELSTKSKILADIFWASIRDELNLWSNTQNITLVIKKGWKIIIIHNQIPPIIKSILDDIFGK
jgi:hypothetical protein